MNDKKRFFRELKRTIKKAGNRKRRRYLKKLLSHDPKEAHFEDFDYGNLSSKSLNGIDQDEAKRKK